MVLEPSQVSSSLTVTISPRTRTLSSADIPLASISRTEGPQMLKLRTLLVGAALALAFICGVAAQQLTSRTLTGSEVVVATLGGPGGSSIFVPMAEMRNATGVVTTALTTGTLSTLTNTTGSTLISTVASVSLTVNLPATPWDGQIFEWCNGTAGAFTAGTVAVTDGSTIVGTTATGALAASASVEYRYVQSTNSWYKVR